MKLGVVMAVLVALVLINIILIIYLLILFKKSSKNSEILKKLDEQSNQIKNIPKEITIKNVLKLP